MTQITKLPEEIQGHNKGCSNNEQTSIVKGRIYIEKPKIKFNCNAFLQYLNDNILLTRLNAIYFMEIYLLHH